MIKRYKNFINESISDRNLKDFKNINLRLLKFLIKPFEYNEYHIKEYKSLVEKGDIDDSGITDKTYVRIDPEESVFLTKVFYLQQIKNNNFNVLDTLKKIEKVSMKMSDLKPVFFINKDIIYNLNDFYINNENNLIRKEDKKIYNNIEIYIYIKDRLIENLTEIEVFDYYDLRYDRVENGRIFLRIERKKLKEYLIKYFGYNKMQEIIFKEKNNPNYKYIESEDLYELPFDHNWFNCFEDDELKELSIEEVLLNHG